MTFQEFEKYCTTKPGVTINYPFKGECAWVKVGGKMFALANAVEFKMGKEMVPPFHFINLKCDPERIPELRARHTAIQPGWHQSKEHWNSLYMDGSLPDQLIYELIDHSYHLVYSSLSAKKRAEIEV